MISSNFFIYNASAGSGKTYTITKAYLCILLKQDQVFAFQNILAITFTNKAAAEMKQRIIQALVYFSGLESQQPHQNLLHDVMSETNMSKEDIQKKSLNILKYLIPNYAGFEVSTIDSFNHRIIRTFAKDLSLTQNFEIDLDTAPYVNQAVENLIEDVGIDEQLTSWLVEFVHYKINQNKSGNIRLDLNKYAELVLYENHYEAIEKLQEYNLKDLKSSQSNLIEKKENIVADLKDIAKAFFELLETQNIEHSSFTRQSLPKYFKNIVNDIYEKEFNKVWHDIENNKLYNAKTDSSQKDKIDSVRNEIEDMFLSSKELSLSYHLIEKVLKSFVPLAMISEINNRINEIKNNQGVLFVNDFNRIISKNIKHQPAPFIYERLGEKFKHYFIDEFQDTSKLQWQNLIPLVDNAITSLDEEGSGGSLYLVGDVKQSIYEWRGGDPKQFLDLSQNQTNPFSVQPTHENLDNNWRSAKAIVEFNNGFFTNAASFLTHPNHKELYKNASQKIKKNIEGYVDIRFLPKLEDKNLMEEQRITQMQKTIVSLVEQGYNLSDICILVRKNKYGTAIAEAFNELDNPIPVVSQESLLIASDAKVQLVTQFLTLVEQYHEVNCIDFMLSWLEHMEINKVSVHQILKEIKTLNALDLFQYLNTFDIHFEMQIYEKLSLYDKAEYVLRALNIDENASAYIQFFLDEIFDFSMSKSKNMIHFLEYWQEQKTRKSISTSEQSDAVKIMTIHKSKGLQFPVVIYAHANFILGDLSQTEDWISLDENQFGVPFIYDKISENAINLSSSCEEAYHNNLSKIELANLNTAYVSMTRAVEQLYILVEPLNSKNVTFKTLLEGYLKKHANYNEDKIHYSFGKNTDLIKTKEAQTQISKHDDFKSYAAQDFYSELTADISTDFNLSDAMIYGQNIHGILQNIEYSKDVESEKYTKEEYSILNNILNHSELSIYFEKKWKVYNESEIVFEHHIFRPDRICIQGNDAVIIDYKTGAEESKHLEQLTNYKKAVEGLGFKVKKAILVYIRKDIYIKSL